MLTTQHLLLVLTSMPDEASARELARNLVTQKLAACVSVLPAAQSVYQWQGKLEETQETGLQIKTSQSCYVELQAAILAAHPYDVPEIIAVPIAAGLPSYLEWVVQQTARPRVA